MRVRPTATSALIRRLSTAMALALVACSSSPSAGPSYDAGGEVGSTETSAPVDAAPAPMDVIHIVFGDSGPATTLDAESDALDARANSAEAEANATFDADGSLTPDALAGDAAVDALLDAADAGPDTGPVGCVAVTVPSGNGGASTCAAPVSGTCGPGSLTGFVATAPPPTAMHQGVCSTAQAQAVYDGCLGPASTNVTCTAAANANGACYACVFTQETAAVWGPLVTTAGGVANLNVGGCLTLLEPCNAACAATLEMDLQCEDRACGANCPITSDPASSTAYSGCSSTIDSCDPGGCATYFYGTSCASDVVGAAHPGAVCFTSQANFEAAYLAIVPVFCGS